MKTNKSTDFGTITNLPGQGVRGLIHNNARARELAAVERVVVCAFCRHLRLREWHAAELIASNPDNAGMFG